MEIVSRDHIKNINKLFEMQCFNIIDDHSHIPFAESSLALSPGPSPIL